MPAAPGVFIGPPFVRPSAMYPHPQPDIALRPIDPKQLPGKKRFYKLARSSPSFPVPYALAALAGAIVGTMIGQRFMSERMTRYALAAILLIAGLRLLGR